MFSAKDILFLVPETNLSDRLKGGFARRVLLLTAAEPERTGNQDFILKVFAAAQINPATDMLWAEINPQERVALTPFLATKKPDTVIVFGLDPGQLGISAELPLYAPFEFYGTTWLLADKLSKLEPDKNLKGMLWRALQQLFLS